jgi:hypothetical protein
VEIEIVNLVGLIGGICALGTLKLIINVLRGMVR